MLTHRALVHEYVSALVAFELSERDVPLHALPLYHSAQMHCFLMPALAAGATDHLVEAPDLDDIFARVPRDGIDSLFFPPTVWVGVANHPGFAEADLSGLRKLFYGASIMPVPVLHRLRERLPQARFFNCFGQSEIGPLAIVLRPEEHDARPDSVGRAVLFVQTRVVDEHLEDVAPGDVGEVVYRSPQLCTGYWGKPEETEEAFRGGWFHSGDLCRIDEEGYLFVVDRIKDVINTGGVLVASREVEDVLYAHPAVAEARGHRTAPRGVNRGRHRGGRALGAGRPRRAHRVRPRAPGRAQGPQGGAHRRRAAQERLGEAAQARTARTAELS